MTLPEPPPFREPLPVRLPFNIAIEPVVLNAAPASVSESDTEAATETFAPALDPGRVAEALSAGLAGVYQSVVTVSVPGGGNRDRAAYLEAAAKVKSDYLYSIAVDRYALSLAGTNGRWWTNTFIIGIFMIPGWWIADETYKADIDLSLVVTAVATGQELERTSYHAEAQVDLDERSKGWTAKGIIFNVTGGMTAASWASLESSLRPVVLGRLRESLVDYRPPELPPKSMGLCIGVTNHKLQAQVPDVPGADQDATTMRELLLATPAKEGVPAFLDQNVRLLPNGAANRGQLLDQLADLAERVKTPDTVVIYFSGHMAVAGDQRYLCPWDFDPAAPGATGIPIDELRKRLEAINSRVLIVILDTSFDSPGADGRTIHLAGADGLVAPAFDPASLLPAREGRVLFLAGGKGQDALSRKKRGLFSTILFEGLGWSWEENRAVAPRADQDGNADVSWKELQRYVSQSLSDLLAPIGKAQVPVLHAFEEPQGEDWLKP